MIAGLLAGQVLFISEDRQAHPIHGQWVGIAHGLCLDLVLFTGPRDIHFPCIGIEASKQHDKKHLSYQQGRMLEQKHDTLCFW